MTRKVYTNLKIVGLLIKDNLIIMFFWTPCNETFKGGSYMLLNRRDIGE